MPRSGTRRRPGIALHAGDAHERETASDGLCAQPKERENIDGWRQNIDFPGKAALEKRKKRLGWWRSRGVLRACQTDPVRTRSGANSGERSGESVVGDGQMREKCWSSSSSSSPPAM